MNDAERISLKEFIKENNALLSALAVFVAISAFLSRLPINWLNSALSFILFGGIVVILYEIQSYFPKDQNKMSLRLFLFNYVIIFGLWGILLYWLLTFRTFWKVFLFFPLFFLFVLMANSTFKPLTGINLFVKIFGIGQKKNTFQLILRDIYWIAIVLLSLIYASIFTPVLNIILDFIKSNFH